MSATEEATQDAPPPRTYGKAGRDLPAAITTGVLLILAVAFTLWRFNWGFVILVTIALCIGAHEVHNALKRKGMTSAIWPIIVGTVAIVIGSYFAGHRPHVEGLEVRDIPSIDLLLASLGLTVIAALVWRMPQGTDGFVRDAAASLFVIGYVPLLGSFVTLMLAGHQGSLRVLSFMLCVMASDTGGYVTGVLFGKHKLAPIISPNKTYEGLGGSFVLAMTVGALVAHFLMGVPFWAGLILGAVCTAVGTCGDLIESTIKRDVGIKDMSSILPGHGGLMDRLDSLLVAAPAAWLVLFLMLPGG